MNHTTLRRGFVPLLLAFALSAASCGSRFEGTYANANGTIILELRSGGKAALTFLGETRQCTYATGGEQLTLDCEGQKTVFTGHDDESLTGPPGSMIGALRKSKS
jgi:hypothetical protein